MNPSKNTSENLNLLNTILNLFEQPYPLWTKVHPNELREQTRLLQDAKHTQNPEQIEQALQQATLWFDRHPFYTSWAIIQKLLKVLKRIRHYGKRVLQNSTSS